MVMNCLTKIFQNCHSTGLFTIIIQNRTVDKYQTYSKTKTILLRFLVNCIQLKTFLISKNYIILQNYSTAQKLDIKSTLSDK